MIIRRFSRFYHKNAWIDPRLEIRPSPLGGRGSYARQLIKESEIVTIWGAEVFTKEEVNVEKTQGRLVVPIGEGLYLAYEIYDNEAPDHFLNHSCDPNIWLVDEVTLVARRAVDLGEELTADYATWELQEVWVSPWSCNCRSHLCRGIITGRDWRLPELQDRYGNHFLPCIYEKINRLKSR
jgi:uncharacterized protein